MEFTFRTNSAKENELLNKVCKRFKGKTKVKAIKKALFYLFNELLEKPDYYNKLEIELKNVTKEYKILLTLLKEKQKIDKFINDYLNKIDIS